jgi:hypothetical protein
VARREAVFGHPPSLPWLSPLSEVDRHSERSLTRFMRE